MSSVTSEMERLWKLVDGPFLAEPNDIIVHLQKLVHGNDHAVAPAVRRRKLPCVPSVIS